jgi:hypothetical protein
VWKRATRPLTRVEKRIEERTDESEFQDQPAVPCKSGASAPRGAFQMNPGFSPCGKLAMKQSNATEH